jgi:hypothetical protein
MARAVRAGLVHMVQLASKTGATLAGKVFLFPRNSSHSPVSHPCDPHHSYLFRIILSSDTGKFELASSVLTSAAKVRFCKTPCGHFLVAHFACFGCSSLSKASGM